MHCGDQSSNVRHRGLDRRELPEREAGEQDDRRNHRRPSAVPARRAAGRTASRADAVLARLPRGRGTRKGPLRGGGSTAPQHQAPGAVRGGAEDGPSRGADAEATLLQAGREGGGRAHSVLAVAVQPPDVARDKPHGRPPRACRADRRDRPRRPPGRLDPAGPDRAGARRPRTARGEDVLHRTGGGPRHLPHGVALPGTRRGRIP